MTLTVYYDPLLHAAQREFVKPRRQKRSGPRTAYELEMNRWKNYDEKEFQKRHGPQSDFFQFTGVR